GLADCAYLAAMRYADGRNAHMLAVIGAPGGAERAIAGAVAEAVRFGGEDVPALDVAFLAPGDAMVARLQAVGLRIDLPEPPDPAPAAPAAPGSDPDKPPILR
ncbi:MAG: SseB family protein, partial [Pseudomonadota bacterium]